MPLRSRFSRRPSAIALLLVVLALGLFFRVAHIDQKLYWHDEVYTSVRTLGYTGREATAALFTGELLGRDDLLKFQRLSPERGWGDTLYALTTHPEHPPLYYLLLRAWVTGFGTSVAAMRSLSAVFSLLCFPALYGFCRRLFGPLVGAIALALWAVSPVQVLYAQEARPYSLWVLVTLLSHLALLRAVQRRAAWNWFLYTAAIVSSAYTSLLTGLVWLCHGLYLIVIKRWRALAYWGLASVGAAALFSPWLWVMARNWGQMRKYTAWITSDYGLWLPQLWGIHFSSAFVDFGVPLDPRYGVVLLLSAALLIGAIAVLWRRDLVEARLVVLLLTVPIGVLALPDILLGGIRSGLPRYILPSLTMVPVAVAHLMAAQWRRGWIAQGLGALLLTMGIASCSLSAQATTWWTKSVGMDNAEAIAFLRQVERPVVITQASDLALGNILSIAHGLPPEVQFQLLPREALPVIPEGGRDRFLFHARHLSDALAKSGFALERVESAPVLSSVVRAASDGAAADP